MVRYVPTSALILLGIVAGSAQPCSICNPNFLRAQTLRQSATQARFIVIAHLANPRLEGERGKTDLIVEEVIFDDKCLGTSQKLTLNSYVPFDPKKPPRYLFMGDIQNGTVDIIRGEAIQGTGIHEYLKRIRAIPENDRTRLLHTCFTYLDATNEAIAADAFHELAKASDQELAEVGKTLSPTKIRAFLKDPRTPADRLSVFAFLLGACGTKEDAKYLVSLIHATEQRYQSSLSGLLGGLLVLDARQGWQLVEEILRDRTRAFADKMSVHNTIRFIHATRPQDHRQAILRCLEIIVEDGEMADMAIEDLRRWHWWDLTKLILAQYGKPGHSAPLVKRSIVRYAISSPNAGNFIAERRRDDPKLVEHVEESLQFERATQPIPK